jgi:hypothetical protein
MNTGPLFLHLTQYRTVGCPLLCSLSQESTPSHQQSAYLHAHQNGRSPRDRVSTHEAVCNTLGFGQRLSQGERKRKSGDTSTKVSPAQPRHAMVPRANPGHSVTQENEICAFYHAGTFPPRKGTYIHVSPRLSLEIEICMYVR